MTPAFEALQQALRKLPGLGYRSSERIALHLLAGKPEQLPRLVAALQDAARCVGRCTRCGNLSEGPLCSLCLDERRNHRLVCVVEQVPDLMAVERSGSWRGGYHVLHGKLSPIHGIGPSDLNLASLWARIEAGAVDELLFALSNDVEGEATCHYLIQSMPPGSAVKTTRIGFGLPSGGGVLYADAVTLMSAFNGRRSFQ